MNIFKRFGNGLSYKEIIQLDGAFSVTHINYGKMPIFNGIDGKNIAINSRKNSLSNQENIEDVIDYIHSFNGTEKNFKKKDRILLWENYWLEYINAFNKLTDLLPNSIVTIYIGRQAIEIGLKYLLLKKIGKINKEHDLGKLSALVYLNYNISNSYMDYVKEFCNKFCDYIEGGNAEYFRFPEYKKNSYFAGNSLDIEWISYNFALIILKLIHFADLDNKFKKND